MILIRFHWLADKAFLKGKKMVENKIKLGYLVATAELRIDEKVTAYQGDMEAAFQKFSESGYDGVELTRMELRLCGGWEDKTSG